MDDRDKGFTEYFASRASSFRATAFLLCGSWHRAADLVRSTFLKLYRAWNRIGGHDVLDAYARQILVRTFLSETRGGFFRREEVTGEPVERTAPEAGSPEDRVVLPHALANVPPMSETEALDAAKRAVRRRRGRHLDEPAAERRHRARLAGRADRRHRHVRTALQPGRDAARQADRWCRRGSSHRTSQASLAVTYPTPRCTGTRLPGTTKTIRGPTTPRLRVSVVTGSFGLMAGYRHPDGTEVMASQAVEDTRYGYAPLSEVPFTTEQLAELAADPRFHLD